MTRPSTELTVDPKVDTTIDRPRYRLTPRALLTLTSSIFFGWPRRDLAYDATRMLGLVTPRPILLGTENIPTAKGLLFVANHYTRPGLWIGWPGAMLVEAVQNIRGGHLYIVVTDAQRNTFRGRGYRVPLSGYFVGRVATIWRMIRISGDANDIGQRASALKQVLRLMKQERAALLFPEGDRGSADHPKPPLPGTGTFTALAARSGSVIPVGFWEDGTQLYGRVGLPMRFTDSSDEAVRSSVETAIRALIGRTERV